MVFQFCVGVPRPPAEHLEFTHFEKMKNNFNLCTLNLRPGS